MKAAILLQAAGSGGGSNPNPSTSLFWADLPINHPLKPLFNESLGSILRAISPRTLQSYITAWRDFKTSHITYNMLFPDFSLLSISSFICYLNSMKGLQTSSIRGYLSAIQFLHKLIYSITSFEINNMQTSLLVKGIQRSQPPHSDARQPITLDILTRCISTLHLGYHSTNTANKAKRLS